METIIVFLAVALLVSLAYYFWKIILIRSTNDVNVLQKYAFSIPFRSPAIRRLEVICSPRFASCSSSEEAWNLYLDTRGLLMELASRALDMAESFFSQEWEKAIQEARNDEQKLLALFHKLPQESALLRKKEEIRQSLEEALRPFTEKRIREAATVKELVFLAGGTKLPKHFYQEHPLDRVDDVLQSLYKRKLKTLVLKEVLATSERSEMSNRCFSHATGDHVIDALIAMKRNFLALHPQFNSFWSCGPLGKEINFALQRFLEQQSDGCS